MQRLVRGPDAYFGGPRGIEAGVTVGEASQTVSSSAGGRAGDRGEDRHSVPIFETPRGSLPDRFAGKLDGRHPALVFFLAMLSGFLVLAAASILLALFVVHVVVPSSGLGLGGSDESVNKTLAEHRTGTLTTIAEIGTEVGGSPVLPILVGIVAIVCAFKRRWLIAAFAVFVLAVESATYRVTSILVPRHRPTVHRLEGLEVDASYPSGHTAASIAVYSGLVLLLTSRFTSSLKKALAWTAAILLTTFVALSRMYEGMHHPLDVAGGVLVGIGAILVLLFACRAAGAAAERRSRA
jgi:membrane-associated phospholipid phosphatase